MRGSVGRSAHRLLPAAEMRSHIYGLVERHDIITSTCRRPDRAWGSRELWEVQIPPVRSAASYATALHEIGHLLGRHQDSLRSMVRERAAWDWAKRNALVWTDRMETHRLTCLDHAARNSRLVAATAERKVTFIPNSKQQIRKRELASH